MTPLLGGTVLEDNRARLMKTRTAWLVVLFALGVWLASVRDPSPVGTADDPTPFELTRIADDRVALNLHGGSVEGLEAPERPVAESTGHVRGRVVDSEGQPVSDVVVLGGARISVMGEVAFGRGGDRTNEDGEFSVETFAPLETMLVAAHHTHGMSALTPATVGGEVELRLQPFAWVEGVVGLESAGVQSRVGLSSTQGSTSYTGHTDASGHYRLGPVPPGEYTLWAFWPEGIEGAVAFPKSRVQVVAGTTTQNITASGPGSVEVKYERTPGLPVSDAAVALFEGRPLVKTNDQFLEPPLPPETFVVRSSISWRDDDAVFLAVPFGTYTACARSNLGDEGLHVECEVIEVRDEETVVVDLSLRAG